MRKTLPRVSPRPPAGRPRLFHRKGVAYFWFFNDRCAWDGLDRQLQEFAAAGDVSAVCLHPRTGLLVPYGGDEWFELIRRVCRRAAELNLRVWLYDEDPFPSGNAGGRIVTERPDLMARGIKMFAFDPDAQGDNRLFCFPTGPLIWCGLVNPKTGQYVDLTSRVGMLRRHWEIHERWDSRYFYPDTPLYASPRTETRHPEYALTVPRIPAGMKLMAFVARRAAFSEHAPYDEFIDSLNPEATRLYLESTHENYRRALGGMFGKEIEAIFTDEPKFYDPNPWTPGLFAGFQREMGYDLRPQLHHLFSDSPDDRAVLTRLHYRQYAADRFRRDWLQPVAKWCRAHKLKLIGHISPEDDPVEQSICLGNLLPLMKEFDLCGIDIIIPAVGDHRHPILSVGVTCATSIAHQQNKAGVMTETGAWSVGISADGIGKILLWQTIMGVTTPLLHAAFSSDRGPRAYERPDFGPGSPIWPQSGPFRRRIAELQEYTHGARQVAPVAILWPIRSFNAVRLVGQCDPTGFRQEFNALLAACLDRQVGTHIIDEADLPGLVVRNGEAVLGRGRYTHILIPSCTVLHARTIKELRRLHKRGITVILAGRVPAKMQTDQALVPADLRWCPKLTPRKAVASLPRLVAIEGDPTDIRCSAWESPKTHGSPVRLLMNIGTEPRRAKLAGKDVTLPPGVVEVIL